MSWYVANSLNQLLNEINASAPNRNKASDGSIGDADHSSRTSDHNPCDCHSAVCARDFTHDPGGGFDSYAFAHWLVDRCLRGLENRGKYVISNGKIASAEYGWMWRPYDGSNPHDHHVHVSVAHPSSLFDNGSGWGWSGDAGPLPPVDTGGFDLSDDQYNKIMKQLETLESKLDSNGAGQNLIYEKTTEQINNSRAKAVRSESGNIWIVTPEGRWDLNAAGNMNTTAMLQWLQVLGLVAPGDPIKADNDYLHGVPQLRTPGVTPSS